MVSVDPGAVLPKPTSHTCHPQIDSFSIICIHYMTYANRLTSNIVYE